MNYIFFYSSAAVLLVIFLICLRFRRLLLPNILIGVATIGYSLINDSLFGGYLRLFHYISPKESNLYMVLAAILLYPILNILYTMFLPQNYHKILLYTAFWIIGMLIFEYFSVAVNTIIFTGWKPIPWSIVLYIVSYLWIFYFYSYLDKKILYPIK